MAMKELPSRGEAHVMNGTALRRSAPPPKLVRLSHRQWQILVLICQGTEATKEIAEVLGIQPNTVNTAVGRMFDRLGVHTKLEAALLADEYRDLLERKCSQFNPHPEGCDCDALKCTALRLGAAQ